MRAKNVAAAARSAADANPDAQAVDIRQAAARRWLAKRQLEKENP